MIVDIVLLLVSLGLLIKGGDLFVSASVRIAESLKIPRVVIGSTLVSLATTSPELVVSILSGLKEESGLAVGNAIGSCICNIGLILGIMAAIKHIDVHPPVLRNPLIAMLLCGVIVFFMTLDLDLLRWHGFVLLGLGALYFLYDFNLHKKDTRPGDIAEATAIEEETIAKYPWFHTGWGSAIQFLIGALIVVVASKILVDSAVNIATLAGIPSIVIGLTVVAVGTSLPELVTAITSSRKNVSDLAIGNVLGANIANLTFIVGSAAAIHPLTLSRVEQVFNFPAMLLMMGLLLYMLLSGKRVTRREGVILLACYGLYIGALVALTVGAR
jgi:cation:H+ antiporter